MIRFMLRLVFLICPALGLPLAVIGFVAALVYKAGVAIFTRPCVD